MSAVDAVDGPNYIFIVGLHLLLFVNGELVIHFRILSSLIILHVF